MLWQYPSSTWILVILPTGLPLKIVQTLALFQNIVARLFTGTHLFGHNMETIPLIQKRQGMSFPHASCNPCPGTCNPYSDCGGKIHSFWRACHCLCCSHSSHLPLLLLLQGAWQGGHGTHTDVAFATTVIIPLHCHGTGESKALWGFFVDDPMDHSETMECFPDSWDMLIHF